MAFELADNSPTSTPVIKVIGVGGGGGNAVNHMIAAKVEGVEFICANTDAQALKNVAAKTVLQLGGEITKGLGAGANPEVGRQAAMEDRKLIEEVLQGADMLFITAGMGGGTGTGAAPVVAEIAKELGILTVAVVTKPFVFEQRNRMQVAEEGIANLVQHVDSLITIPNERLLAVMGKVTLVNAFASANDVLLNAVQGIAELITNPGLINLDFADVRTVMSEMGMAMMGSGTAKGDQRAREAAEQAVYSPLLEDVDLKGARGILVNVIGNSNMGLHEFQEVVDTVTEYASEDATVIVGTSIDNSLEEELRVTIVATGLEQAKKVEAAPEAPSKVAAKPVRLSARAGLAEMDTAASQAAAAEARQAKSRINPKSEADINYLDIPAFLRKQAD